MYKSMSKIINISEKYYSIIKFIHVFIKKFLINKMEKIYFAYKLI